MKRRNTIAMLVLLAVIGWGSRPASAFNKKSITNRDGLTNSSVLSFCDAQSGMMLFGTCDGVFYYNGSQVIPINYQLKRGVKINGPVVEDIIQGHDDLMWVLTNHGLSALRRNSDLTFYPQFAGLNRLKTNPEGDLFLLSADTLHYAMGIIPKFGTIAFKNFGGGGVRDFIITDKYVYLFLADGIYRSTLQRQADGWTATTPQHLYTMPMASAHQDGDTEFLVDEQGHLWSYRLADEVLTPLADIAKEQKRGPISAIRRFQGNIMVGFLTNGMIALRPEADGYTTIDYGFNVGIMNLYTSQQGEVLWVGTDGQGVVSLFNSPLSQRSITNASLNINYSKPVRSLLIDSEKTLWVGSKGDGLIRFPRFDMDQIGQPEYQKLTTATCGISGNIILALTQSRSHNGFFAGGDGGIDFYSLQTHTFTPVDTPERIAYVSAICERGDTLWITTQGMGIYRGIIKSRANGRLSLTNVKRFLLDGGLKSSNYFFCMTIAPDGTVYLGNRGKGLYTIGQGDKLQYISPQTGKQNHSLYDIFSVLTTDGGLWIGTGCGLAFHGKDGTTRIFDVESGMPNEVIHALTEDADGNVWASTNQGIVCFRHGGPDFQVFASDNMEVLEFSDGAVFSQDNLVIFGGINGTTFFQLNDETPRKDRHFIAEITDISILGRAMRLDDYVTIDGKGSNTVHLNYDQNTFQFTLSTYDYIGQSNYAFFYNIDDKDHWIYNGGSPTLTFTHLQPGRYTLYVKYKDTLSGEESPVFTHHIVITPPIYQSWWAYMLYVLVLLSLAFVLFRRWQVRHRQQQHLQEVQLAQERREEIYGQKLRFMANLVHELNTPLTLIYGPCERILAYEGADDTVRHYIRLIMQNVGRLNYLVKEIIDFRRISDGHETVRLRAVVVSEWVTEMANAFTELAEDNNIVYEHDLAQDLVWNTDERLLTRIVTNLVSNAFKYTKRGGTIRVRLWQDAERHCLLFSVYNTGKGIAERDRHRIFDYYTVLDNVDESDTVGLTSRNGLGMAICHQAITRLGGSINIDSVENEYACFTVELPWTDLPDGADATPCLPIYAQPPVQEQQSTTTQEEPTVIPGERLRTEKSYKIREDAPVILVIDDNRDILDLLQETMSNEYNVLTAQSAEQGLEVLKTQMPDLIVTDLMMPGMDGMELTQTLKQNKHTRQIPLVILSAKRTVDEHIEGLESGADAYISKPFSPNYLMATVSRLLENRLVLKEYFTSSASTFAYQDGKLITNEEREFRSHVNDILDKNLTNTDFTPEEMARQMGYSLRNLYRKFNDAGLPTPKDYIKKYRITLAAQRLLTTNLTIQEIIYSTGFNTRNLFYTEFRKYYGMTPKEYRERQFVKDDSLG